MINFMRNAAWLATRMTTSYVLLIPVTTVGRVCVEVHLVL